MMSLMPCTALAENVIGDSECLEETCSGFDRLHEAFVGNHDHGVDAADQFGERLLRLLLAALAFEREWLGDNRNGERSQFACERCHDGSSAAAGAAAQAGGEKNHVGAFERLDDLVSILKRGLASNLRVRARAESLGELSADLQLYGRLGKLQRLQIRIGGDEFNTFDNFGTDPSGLTALHPPPPTPITLILAPC